MARRFLSDQQHRRIHTKLEKKLSGSQQPSQEAASNLGSEQSGLVISHHGQTIHIESVDGTPYFCHVRQNLGSIVVGDQVIWQAQIDAKEPCGIIVAKESRRSVLTRASQYKPTQELAANIDQIMVVLALYPTPIEYYLDQHLVAAELQNLPCQIVLNKIDFQTEHPIPPWLQYYETIGYSIIYASTKTTDGLAQLMQEMQHKNSILVGQSGVGKSSLINALIDGALAKTGNVSELNKRGKHTTAASRLYHLRNGGCIIDSPGVREFGICETSANKIITGFKEFLPYLGHCKFRNCNHRNTQGCAIETKVNSGEISYGRLQSYFRIIDNLPK